METITAISTPVGIGGLGIIRISGPRAFSIIREIFISKKYGKKFLPKNLPTHTLYFGFLVCRGKKIDEVLLSIFKSPHSYTGEDTVEVTCHGGALVMENALSAILATGKARLAEQGEFTKKAFLNDRIDLIQAEAVSDIIEARTSSALDAAVSQLQGHLSEKINSFKESLLHLLSDIEAKIEFPEDLAESETRDQNKALRKKIRDLLKNITSLIQTFDAGEQLRQGINVVIVGAPNSGKSTLLNSLLGFERAIVTSVPGTTRDFLKESLFLEGALVNFIDTAGMRKARDIIEKKGVSLTRKSIQDSTIALHVVDGSQRLTADDWQVARELKDIKNKILVINKKDKKKHPSIRHGLPGYRTFFRISAKKGQGVEDIKKEIVKTLKRSEVRYDARKTILTNVRHRNELGRCREEIEKTLFSLKPLTPEDIISQGIKNALHHLNNLSGATTPDDVLNRIFSRFCIGK
ncbi:MAG: tRNA uridine-5-carboxymethylaminomethyl(34) synthesis GTPase MnmE [Candidatus Aureabacteria bacterium]|nr:tRNA uridine-5-carboxymethylaminomethyl(34) synthesis GTPase MnmE [Candidatus Auribacterota bacterium]